MKKRTRALGWFGLAALIGGIISDRQKRHAEAMAFYFASLALTLAHIWSAKQ